MKVFESEGLTLKELQENYLTILQFTEILRVGSDTVSKHLAPIYVRYGMKYYIPIRDVQVLLDMKEEGKSKSEISKTMREIGRLMKTKVLSPEKLERDYYIPQQASSILGVSHATVTTFFNDVSLKTGTGTYIPKSEVERWLEFKNRTVMLTKVIIEVAEGHGFGELAPKKNITLIAKSLRNSGITVITDAKTPFHGTVFVNKADLDKVKQFTLNKLRLDKAKFEGNKSYHKLKVEIMLEEKKNLLIPITTDEFRKFILSKFENVKGITFPIVELIYKLLLDLQKELMEHTDEEMELLVGKIEQEQTNKVTSKQFCDFINLLRNKYPTKYVNDYKYDQKAAEKKVSKREVQPYTEEQFFRFGLLLLNDTHPWFEDYMEKATTRRAFASVWLYCLLHYVCAWRAVDMRNIPFPKLPIDTSTDKPMVAEKFIELVKTGQFTEEMAQSIVKDVKMRIDYFKRKPQKTTRYNPPDLVFEPPTSTHYRLGMLLGLCEAHRRCSRFSKSLLTVNVDTKPVQHTFFGPEFIDIFGDNFTNERGAKTYLNLMAKKADEKKLGSGHVLASIARSHKFSPGKVSDTTSIYLKYMSGMTNSNILIKELFERGVCSFVPFLLLMTLEGEESVKKLPHVEQTEKMKELIPYSPYDGERLLLTHDKAIERAKLEVQRIIRHFSKENVLDIPAIHKFIDKIACNTAPAKQENMNCISVAMGNGCIYPERKNCIGCGQEIYLISSLHLVGQQVRSLADKVEESKTSASKLKNEMILKQVIKPILNEIITTLKYVYGVKDLSLYKEIVSGVSVKNEVLQ
ncbi:hypothetical protein II1_03303 [Bacillus cereus MC118]|nr:hypothetical protein II1_03303 [Bacillus cereus MC118]